MQLLLEEKEDEEEEEDEAEAEAEAEDLVYTEEEAEQDIGTKEVDGGMVGKSRTCLKGLFSGRSLTSLVRSIDLNHESNTM